MGSRDISIGLIAVVILFSSQKLFATDQLDIVGLTTSLLNEWKEKGGDTVPKEEIHGKCEVTTFFCNRIDIELFDSKNQSVGRARPDEFGSFLFLNLNPSDTYYWEAKTDKGIIIGKNFGLKAGRSYILIEPVK